MINLNTATRIIGVEIQKRAEDQDPVITQITEYPVGWLFYWTTRKAFLATDFGDMILGNGPMLVDKRNGNVIHFGTGNPEEEVDVYVRKYFDNPPDSS